MTNKTYTAKEIAKWFIQRAAKDAKNGGEYLTQLKLQKLMYYAKGFYYVFENNKLFPEKIEAQKLGPVVPSLVSTIKKYSYNPIIDEFKNEKDITDEVVLNVLNFVYEKVGQFSAKKLVDCTHNESPWKNVQIKDTITEDSISDYFKNTYLKNLSKDNDFEITDSEIYNIIFKNTVLKNKEAFMELAK